MTLLLLVGFGIIYLTCIEKVTVEEMNHLIKSFQLKLDLRNFIVVWLHSLLA